MRGSGPGSGPGAARDALILRTDRADTRVRRLIDRYSGLPGLDLVVATDDRKAPLDLPAGLRRVALTDAGMTALGLEAVPNWGWSCGDYALYAVRQAHRQYRHYWMIEPDVALNADSPLAVFDRFATAPQDFLTTLLSRRNADWAPMRRIAPHYAQVWGCLFALVRLSGRALDHLLAERVALGRRLRAASGNGAGDDKPLRWPNDEAFVATVLANAGLASADLGKLAPDLCTPGRGWSYRFPVHAGAAFLSRPDGRIYHPIVAEPARFKARLLRLIERHPGDLPGTLDRLEWSLATVPQLPDRPPRETDPGADLVLSVLLHAARLPALAGRLQPLAARLLPQAPPPGLRPLHHRPAGMGPGSGFTAEHLPGATLTRQGTDPATGHVILAGPDGLCLVPPERLDAVLPR